MSSAYAVKPFSYLAPTKQAAPKTGFRKEEGVYGDITASLSSEVNQQQQPPVSTAPFQTSPTGSGAGPPVAAKPTMMRHDRPSGFDADWRLRGNGEFGYLSAEQQPEMSNNNAAFLSTTRIDRSDDDARMMLHAGNSELISASSHNVYNQQPTKEPSNVKQPAIRPTSILPPPAGVDGTHSTYESAVDIIRTAAAKNQNAAKVLPTDERGKRDELFPENVTVGVNARTPTAEDDVGGGLLDNFILVGPSARTSEDRAGAYPHPPQQTNRLEEMFTGAIEHRHEPISQRPSSGGNGFVDIEMPTDYVVHSAALSHSGNGVNGKRPDKLPRTTDAKVEALGVDNRSFDEPDYKLYSGVTGSSASAIEQQYSPVTENDSRPASFNKADVLLVPRAHKTTPSDRDARGDGEDCRCGSVCRCSRSTVVVIIIVLVVVGLIFFGVGFIAGWFGHVSPPDAAAAAGASTTASTSFRNSETSDGGGAVALTTSQFVSSSTVSTGSSSTSTSTSTTSTTSTTSPAYSLSITSEASTTQNGTVG